MRLSYLALADHRVVVHLVDAHFLLIELIRGHVFEDGAGNEVLAVEELPRDAEFYLLLYRLAEVDVRNIQLPDLPLFEIDPQKQVVDHLETEVEGTIIGVLLSRFLHIFRSLD